MGKKIILSIAVISVLLLALGGGIFAYFKFAKGGVGDVSSTSDDGFATLSATFYDFSGDPVSGGVTQALIGGTSKRTHVKFEILASNTGNVDLTNVRTTSPNANMNGAFDNIVSLSNLDIGESGIVLGSTAQSCGSSDDCDSNEECQGNPSACYIALDNYASGTSLNNVDFTISLQANFIDAVGTAQTVTSDPVTLTYDIREEKCDDGTTINSCVHLRTGLETDKPDYCEFTEGSAPSIVDKASVCGCPTGYHENGDVCEEDTCQDGTPVGSCSTESHEGTYGAYYFCLPDLSFEARCNECGATLDAHGNPKEDCTSTTDPSSAVYQDYTGGLSGSLTE